MAMEHPEVLESVRIMNESVSSCSDGFGQGNSTIKESENLGDDIHILDDLDSYLQDIEDRLMISRMVSDSVIKGMVGAVEQQAADSIYEKELEIRKLKERLHSPVCLNEDVDFLKKKREEIISLRQELDSLNKLFNAHEASHITSHGSMEIAGECSNGSNGKVTAHHPRKLSESHVFPPPPWETNGKHDEVTIAMPENIVPAKLGHLSREDLVDHFKTEMIRMKRNHEAMMEKIIDWYYLMLREYLKDRGSVLHLKKDKDLDCLKRKIPEIISQLDDILKETEVIPSINGDLESLSNMKELISENHQLSNMLADKKRQMKRLSAEVSDAGKKISEYSMAKEDLLGVIRTVEEEKEEIRINALICEEVYQCLLRQLPADMCYIDSNFMEPDADVMICEMSRGEAVADVRSTSETEIERLYLESMFSGVVYTQSLIEAMEQIDCLSNKYLSENVFQVSLEQKILEQAESIRLEVVENQKLRQDMLQLTASVEENQRIVEETGHRMARERELFDQANHELVRLRNKTKSQGIMIGEINKESEEIRSNLQQALEKIEKYKEESSVLNEKLSFVMNELNMKEAENKMFLLAIQEKCDKVLLAEVNEKAHQKQMESVMEASLCVIKSLADFESRATMDIERKQSRLDMLRAELKSLTQDAKLLKRKGLSYKHRLEKKCLDLEKAEKEVDLLGDDVDNLLGLLEKIYIALDHYSPVFKHYPGVMEILKLVKKELSGGSL